MSLKNTVLENRFLKNGESEDKMYLRVARFVADNEDDEQDFYNIMSKKLFLPNTPTLINAGKKESSGQLAACFVLPIDDSMDQIYETLKNAAVIQKSGGGVGYDFSSIRPKNDPVKSSQGVASGPISFMKAYDASTDTIKQGGVRRGANMAILRVDHPDIEEFIECKKDTKELNSFNLSIGMTDDFINAIKNDIVFELKFNNKVYKTIKAKELYNKIVKNAHETGEPGVIFIDQINKYHPLKNETIAAVNPCVTGDTKILTDNGNIPIKELVNKQVNIWNGHEWSKVTPKITGENQEILIVSLSNGMKLKCTPYHKFLLKGEIEVTADSLKLGDKLEKWEYPVIENNNKNVKNVNIYITDIQPQEQLEKYVYCFNEPKRHRGIFDNILTMQCGEQPLLPYESCNLGSINLSKFIDEEKKEFNTEYFKKTIKTAVKFLDNIIDKNKYPMDKIKEVVERNRKIGLGVMGYADMLIKMGLVYGSEEANNFTKEIAKLFSDTAKNASHNLALEKESFPNFENSLWDAPMRNATVTTIAPTGTISILAETSGGIEPVFSPYYYSNRMDQQILVIHPLFKEMLIKKDKLKEFEKLAKKYNEDLDKLPLGEFDQELKTLFKNAHDIKPEEHVKVQSIWQKNIDNAVSKTINLPNKATLEDVQDIYLLAYDLGLKGITIYRDGSRGYAVLSSKNSNKKNTLKRDEWQKGYTTKIPTGCGSLWITINENKNGKINEVFISNSSDGGCPNIQGEARLISLLLRNNIPIEDIIDQLTSVRCPRSIASKRTKSKSCSDAVAITIKEYLNKGNEKVEIEEEKLTCPDCKEILDQDCMVEGCITCKNCGWSKCS